MPPQVRLILVAFSVLVGVGFVGLSAVNGDGKKTATTTASTSRKPTTTTTAPISATTQDKVRQWFQDEQLAYGLLNGLNARLQVDESSVSVETSLYPKASNVGRAAGVCADLLSVLNQGGGESAFVAVKASDGGPLADGPLNGRCRPGSQYR